VTVTLQCEARTIHATRFCTFNKDRARVANATSGINNQGQFSP